MRILYVWPSAEYSTYDVGVGYRDALAADGHEIHDFHTYTRIKWMSKLLNTADRAGLVEVSWNVSRMIAEEAVDFIPDWCVIVSGMSFHPIGLVYLQRLSTPIATIFTESPYDDENQEKFAGYCDIVATNDLYSAQKYDWIHLPAAYSPLRHRNDFVDGTYKHDVVIVGTGWGERTRRLAEVDWSGINLGIYGFWPQLGEDQSNIDIRQAVGLIEDVDARNKLGKFYSDTTTTNDETASLYAHSKICVNDHRVHPDGFSVNPRCIEVLAVGGGLLLTDWRPELETLLGFRVREFVYNNSTELGQKVNYFLTHEAERQRLVDYGRKCVERQTFEARTAALLGAMERHTYSSERKLVLVK